MYFDTAEHAWQMLNDCSGEIKATQHIFVLYKCNLDNRDIPM